MIHQQGSLPFLSLGNSRMRLSFAQGLFHPARKVREVYWRLYNETYVGAQVTHHQQARLLRFSSHQKADCGHTPLQDALVAFYPRLEDDSLNQYERWVPIRLTLSGHLNSTALSVSANEASQYSGQA